MLVIYLGTGNLFSTDRHFADVIDDLDDLHADRGTVDKPIDHPSRKSKPVEVSSTLRRYDHDVEDGSTGNDVFPRNDLARLLRRPRRGRRRRDVEGPTDASVSLAVAGLDRLGIVVTNPGGADVVSSIFDALLRLVFLDGGDLTSGVGRNDAISTEETADRQRATLNAVKRSLEQIRRRTTVVAGQTGDLRRLYHRVDARRCEFMDPGDLRRSLAYFRKFVLVHLVVNQALIVVDRPNRGQWKDRLNKNVADYVNYAAVAVRREATDGRHDVRAVVEPEVVKWIGQLPAGGAERSALEAAVDDVVRDGGAVSFRYGDDGHWLSCSGVRSRCNLGDCSGFDNPMERGTQYEYRWKCRAEVFWIHIVDDDDGAADNVVLTCSRVALESGVADGRRWWLSARSRGGGADTDACSPAGGGLASMRRGRCARATWRVRVDGKPCGAPVVDRDHVTLASEHNYRGPGYGCSPRFNVGGGRAAQPSTSCNDPGFTIFRSDVRRDDVAGQPCA